MKKYNVVVVEPNMVPVVKKIDGCLDSYHDIVDGYIECINIDRNTCLVCNDEGKLIGLDKNRYLCDHNGDPYDILCGTFFVIGDNHDGEFRSLTDDECKWWCEYFNDIPTDFDDSLAEPRFDFISW